MVWGTGGFQLDWSKRCGPVELDPSGARVPRVWPNFRPMTQSRIFRVCSPGRRDRFQPGPPVTGHAGRPVPEPYIGLGSWIPSFGQHRDGKGRHSNRLSTAAVLISSMRTTLTRTDGPFCRWRQWHPNRLEVGPTHGQYSEPRGLVTMSKVTGSDQVAPRLHGARLARQGREVLRAAYAPLPALPASFRYASQPPVISRLDTSVASPMLRSLQVDPNSDPSATGTGAPVRLNCGWWSPTTTPFFAKVWPVCSSGRGSRSWA